MSSHDDPVSSPLDAQPTVYWRLSRARLIARGGDAKAFLHRMSTQHCASLEVGDSRLNVFTTKQGRIVDVVQQMQLDEDQTLLLSSLSSGTILREWLETFVFVEDVAFEEISEPQAIVLLAGEAGPKLAAEWLGIDAHELALSPWAMYRQGEKIVLRGFDLSGVQDSSVPSLWLLSLRADSDDAEKFLYQRGVPRADDTHYQSTRIAAGVPAPPGEICDRFNPLEVQLHDAIHWDKGCYIGQEVISRIDNYGKQSRWLVGVIFADHAQDLPEVGAAVRTMDEQGNWHERGVLTSVGPQIVSGRPSAIAWLKSKDFPGMLQAEIQVDANWVPVRLVERAAAQSPAS